MPIFIPISSPGLGDGPLRAVNFVRRTCAEKRAFYALSCVLKYVRMLFLGSKIALAMGVKIEVRLEQLSPWVYKLRYGESCSIRVPGYG